ncbi:MAG: UmuC domain-containing protein [Lactococcus sp.]|jgi:DNA polymerase V
MITPDFDYTKEQHRAIAFIDMKSFYASVECVALGLDPLTTSLCVMSQADNSGGLILASSPTFKQVFGKSNVGRSRDLPFYTTTRRFNYQNYYRTATRDWLNRAPEPTPSHVAFIESWAKRTIMTPPRMSAYIDKNMEIQHIIQNFAAVDDICWYSIDEGFVDLTESLSYFYPDKNLTPAQKLDAISHDIQVAIYQQTGLYATIGMSIGNPLLAKLALDNAAKHAPNMRALWTYDTIAETVWQIPDLTDFWGISRRTAKRLRRLGVNTIYELAHTHPAVLKKEFGVLGVQLYCHANGIDESRVSEKYEAKRKSIGNSQTLPRDYAVRREIELVISELAEQVAIRTRRAKKKTCLVSLYVGFGFSEGKSSIHAQMAVEPTNSTQKLTQAVFALFREKYASGAVRRIGVSYGQLCEADVELISLFEDPQISQKQEAVQDVIDAIREKYGFLSVQKANSLASGSRVMARSKLVGGHSAGGLDGLR